MNEPVTALYSWPPIVQSLNMGKMEAGGAPRLHYIIHDCPVKQGFCDVIDLTSGHPCQYQFSFFP